MNVSVLKSPFQSACADLAWMDIIISVDEQTIMELYAPPFEAAASRAAGYMCSCRFLLKLVWSLDGACSHGRRCFAAVADNRINGKWSCENPETLKTMLKGYFNFSGFVV